MAALVDPTPTPADLFVPRPPEAPRSVRCRGIDVRSCRQIVRASVDALASNVRAVRAVVYPSLVCGDDVDCPRSLLADNTPVGSVVLTLGDGTSAWVNVVATETTSFDDQTRHFIVRIVRWFPPRAQIAGWTKRARPSAME
jgi:hypothetical protein